MLLRGIRKFIKYLFRDLINFYWYKNINLLSNNMDVYLIITNNYLDATENGGYP